MDADEVRALALALPQTSEQPHFENASLRVGRSIFATIPPAEDVVRIFLSEEQVREATAQRPDVISELWWGKKLWGVQVRLADAPDDLVAELIDQAWRRKAPRKVVAAYDEPPHSASRRDR